MPVERPAAVRRDAILNMKSTAAKTNLKALVAIPCAVAALALSTPVQAQSAAQGGKQAEKN